MGTTQRLFARKLARLLEAVVMEESRETIDQSVELRLSKVLIRY